MSTAAAARRGILAQVGVNYWEGLKGLSIGFADMIPLLAASVKLFSTSRAQKYAYAWYFVVMNIGSAIADAYNVIMFGGFISAASVLIMGAGEAIVFIVLFQVVLVGGSTLLSPIALLLGKRWLDVQSRKRAAEAGAAV